MIAIDLLFIRMLCDFFKPRPRLEAEILILRHQLNVMQQRTPRRRLHLRWVDRALFIWLYRRYPRILDAMSIVRPDTVVRWHRKGLARYWRLMLLRTVLISLRRVAPPPLPGSQDQSARPRALGAVDPRLAASVNHSNPVIVRNSSTMFERSSRPAIAWNNI
jgi:hypothetical protein